MRIFSILLFITGVFVTSWVTVVSHNNAVKPTQFNELPLFLSQNCKLKYVENNVVSEDDKRKNLSIYYSGIAGIQEKDLIEIYEKNKISAKNEADIQKKIKEIVEERKNLQHIEIEQKSQFPKKEEKIALPLDKKDSKKSKKSPLKKKSVFDVID